MESASPRKADRGISARTFVALKESSSAVGKRLSPLKRYLPHLRVLPEDLAVLGSGDDTTGSVCTADSRTFEEKADATRVSDGSEEAALQLEPGRCYELRDEAGRKWWRFFSEYEYRVNKAYLNGRKWYQFLYPNHSTKSQAERTLLYKLDIVLGLYFLMLCWCKSLDSNNLMNTYISGMREDLGMHGNDLIYTSTISKVGAIIFQLPFIYLLPKYPSVYILPLMDLGWSFFTIMCAFARTVPELQAYRFIISAFGAAYYPVSQYVLGLWYAPDELSSRVCLFFCGQLLGGVTSGVLQARIYKSLNNAMGLAGWRWMFLIDGLAISIPTVIIGFFVLPGVPSKCYSLFLTDEEIRIARKRNRQNHIVDSAGPGGLLSLRSWSLWKKVLLSPTLWVLVVFDTCSWNNMTAFSGSFGLWLDDQRARGRWSVVAINNLSALPAALGFAYVFFCAWGADLFRSRWFFLVFAAVMNCISCGLLVRWDIPEPAKWFAFLTTYWSVAPSPCLWAYINDFLRADPQVKAVSWIIIYSVSQSSYAWIPTLVWKTTDAPVFRAGYISSLAFGAVYGLWTFVVLYLYKRTERRRALENGIILYNSARSQQPPAFVASRMERRGDYYYLRDAAHTAR
ncbi:AaceriAFR578Cp [[Ashbya] aceris (nom. inval.)]|nr:AaceriAFR578Cp [[Ashbya] aceris (nom. inval.)]